MNINTEFILALVGAFTIGLASQGQYGYIRKDPLYRIRTQLKPILENKLQNT